MEIIKPLSLSLLTRPIEYRKRYGLCITAMAYFPFSEDGSGPLYSEVSLVQFLAKALEVPIVDVGITKTTGEFLVFGNAYAPGGEAPGCAVRAKVGALEKTLLVFGDRWWNGAQATRPEPFASMPLTWDRAYGGPGFPQNPLGRGREKIDVGGQKLQPLPNLETARQRATRPDTIVPPVGFGMIDPLWPQRAQTRGTYDEAWFKEHSPGFAPDLSWKHFNVAPQDQWFPALPVGDETYEFENLHPAKPLLRGKLPGLRARVFCNVKRNGDTQLREVPMGLTTLCFFPSEERCVAIFHGLLHTQEEDAADVTQLMAGFERLGEPRSDEHYAKVRELRTDPEYGAMYSLRERDLLPEGLAGNDPAIDNLMLDYTIEGHQGEAQLRRAQLMVRQVRARLEAAGMDPDAMGVKEPQREPPPLPDDLADYVIAKKAEQREHEIAALHELADRIEQENARAIAAGERPKPIVTKRGPPTFSALSQAIRLTQQVPVTALGPDGKPLLDLPALMPRLQQVENAERLNYLLSAHLQSPVDPMPPEQATALKAEAQAAHAQKKSFRRADLTGADLSGLDLRHADFTDAWLEGVDFRGANLSRAKFSGAVLAHADLRGAVLIAADFQAANLGKAKVDGAVFDLSDFTNATLMYTDFSGSSFVGATLHGAQLLEARYGPSDWTNAKSGGQLFVQRDLKGMVFAGAKLGKATFVECDVTGVDFAHADLTDASFVNCKGAGARFVRATMERTAFAQDCDFSSADFSGAIMPGANLRTTKLDGATFSAAVLEMADLSGASLQGARMDRAAAIGALLVKSDLRKADARGFNLMNAVLQRADLRGTDLRGGNFFGSDLSRVRLDSDTRLDDSEFKRARTYPRFREPAPEAGTP